ncbi:MAG: ABC transporter substrate-binding protein [Anaerolineae bacterium]|nr:ABC transporter substrate-binding protein [Anaerolineae bacterium]
MFKKLLAVLLISLMVTAPVPLLAQDDIPTVAIIRLGPLPPFQYSQQGTLDVLAAYGYVDGENIKLILGDAGMDVPTANLLIEDAINSDVDVIVTITTPVSQAAVNATLDMEDPPIIMFNTVTQPYAAGIAQAPCIKPAHVWGSQALPDFATILPLVWELNPEIKNLGWIYSTSEPNAVASTEIVQPIAAELGLTLHITSVAESSEVGAAAEALAGEGIDAFFIPTDSTVGNALASILSVAEEEGIPVFFADSLQVFSGVTVGAGVSYYQEGVDTGRVLVAYLNGDIDIATTGLSKQSGTLIGVNLDTAAMQDVEVPQNLLDMANFVIEDGENTGEVLSLPDVSFEELQEQDAAFVENLFCSEERIAEQQAELDAQ